MRFQGALSEDDALRQIAGLIAAVIDAPREEPRTELQPKGQGVDALLSVGPFRFAIEWKSSSSAGAVSAAVDQLRCYVERNTKPAIPLVAVPHMGQLGARLCEESNINWVDLSGNAKISAPGLRIIVEGRPNRFKSKGRPSTPFAPKSSRITRWLLTHPDQWFTQRQVSRATGVDEGHTSKVVARLEEERFLDRNDAGAIRPRDPDLFFNAWREEYDFSKHHIIQGHVAARSGSALLNQLASVLRQEPRYAFTALAAAWLYSQFAGFTLVTAYLSAPPSDDLLERLRFRQDERGANCWIVVPNDEGVFQGGIEIQCGIEVDSVSCVHPIQAHLDLKKHPGRSPEAAEQLRRELWRSRSIA